MKTLDRSRPVRMLNLLRYRAIATGDTLSGEAMYAKYLKAAVPILEVFGAKVLLEGQPLLTLVGPKDEKWDRMLIVRYPSLQRFLEMARYPDFLEVSTYRQAALEDHRLIVIGE
ncbi:DUF1330 domain-containing protein [Lewinella sp. IMCC34191]|uniref:DUF1330 domain-containing protein n=1 Tax=Lewinella sp. IMCC34191 TaxID=2259172 RepID=UPI001300825C|nr:DUF1330 domain-containing protein [Lewinella sp. IMCC34191]